MKEIRNGDNKLVAVFEEATSTIVIVHRGCETRIRLNNNGSAEITNIKLNSV